MKKIADISAFEKLMNEACHHSDSKMKSNVAVFNNMQDIENIIKSYGFDVEVDRGSGKSVRYIMHPTQEMVDAAKTLSLAYVTDKWWASRNINYRDTLSDKPGSETSGSCLIATLESRDYAYSASMRNGEVVHTDRGYEGDCVRVCFYHPSIDGRIRFGSWDCAGVLDEVENGIDGTWCKIYDTFISDSLIPSLQSLKERADLTIAEANKWKERRAVLRDKEMNKAMKVAESVITPTPASEFMSVPDPFYDDSYID